MNSNLNIIGRRNSLANRQASAIGTYAAANNFAFITYSAAVNTIQQLSRIAVPEAEYQTDLVTHYAQANAFEAITRSTISTTIQSLINIVP